MLGGNTYLRYLCKVFIVLVTKCDNYVHRNADVLLDTTLVLAMNVPTAYFFTLRIVANTIKPPIGSQEIHWKLDRDITWKYNYAYSSMTFSPRSPYSSSTSLKAQHKLRINELINSKDMAVYVGK